MITFRPSPKFDKEASVLLFEKSQDKQIRIPKHFDAPLREQIEEIVNAGQFHADGGEVFPLLLAKKMFLLVGIGRRQNLSLLKFRMHLAQALRSSYMKKINDIEILPHDNRDETIKAIIEAILVGGYTWRKYNSKMGDEKLVSQKDYVIVANKKKIYEENVAVCEGTNLTRDLVNENADVTTSEYLEKVVKKIVKGNKKISLEILNKKEMKEKGLNLHLAVNQGSKQEPRLIIVKYQGASKKSGFTALIGKGMTFDTGGLNLKPTGHIESMKLDMSGAAAVIGALKNTVSLNLKKNILFVCGLAENVTGSHAYKPGDIIRSFSGKTVEVANTDAEGRLVLADAISYVVKNYQPEKIVDIATLTGACIVALGYDYTGLVSNDEQFARQLIRSSKETDDRVWQLPCYPELKESVQSQVADIRNLGTPKGAGGTLTAAEFLRQFVEDTRWAHLDIAGTAFVENAKRHYFAHGATGAGVRLLTHYLQNN